MFLIEAIPWLKSFLSSSAVSTVWAVAPPFKDFTMIYILFMQYQSFLLDPKYGPDTEYWSE